MFFFRKSPVIVRKIHSAKNEIYLTFDDGPTEDLTPQVLDLLKEMNAKANFFVIGDEARKHPDILKRIVQEGHGLFSHSLDHAYRNYFKGTAQVKNWIENSLADLNHQSKQPQKAFRPPAGILTPPLITAAEQLQCPLVLWSHRFFDTTHAFTEEKALASLKTLRSGDIILLHDRQKTEHQELFLKTLRKYLQETQTQGYRCACLSDSVLQEEVLYASHSSNDARS
ncbi:polysaccharide deacetylase family protein [Bdellovibrio sp. SKB1291214]|uniref:polysaccharide deacetylase family protein n=1 Tax=Bdellovibrio sp. SKB1291214 TaxID=1732569 RepID=UPI000B51834F|nr:polysaccharide deacetylase family protein [Bdellovibrio sp. SKB1291214]UYL09608.1 polysaccharide deacetylase family protein [Bdellovibrio sp. SKB1291214]